MHNKTSPTKSKMPSRFWGIIITYKIWGIINWVKGMSHSPIFSLMNGIFSETFIWPFWSLHVSNDLLASAQDSLRVDPTTPNHLNNHCSRLTKRVSTSKSIFAKGSQVVELAKRINRLDQRGRAQTLPNDVDCRSKFKFENVRTRVCCRDGTSP